MNNILLVLVPLLILLIPACNSILTLVLFLLVPAHLLLCVPYLGLCVCAPTKKWNEIP